jgi:probable HAF family extracellular repeat protein
VPYYPGTGCIPSQCGCIFDGGRYTWGSTLDCIGECIDPPVPAGPPTYTIAELPTPLGEGMAHAVNNVGQAVGEAFFPGFSGRHACLWDNGMIIDLTPLANGWTSAKGINNARQIILLGGYIWENGTLTALGSLFPEGRTNGRPFAINDLGQIVGTSQVPFGGGTTHPFLWEDGVMIDLYEAHGLGSVNHINNLGHLVGTKIIDGVPQAILWREGVTTVVGSLGGQYAVGRVVNDSDVVAGYSERPPGGERLFYSFIWQQGNMVDLAAQTGYGGPSSSTMEGLLNNCGNVLLDGDPWSRGTDFFLYSIERGLRPVRGVTRPAAPWARLFPRAINDRGQIVGNGDIYGLCCSRSFIMSPVPGDADTDGDVDLRDFAEFQCAYTGAKEPDIPGCERNDLDADADVDAADFALFAQTLNGPGVAPR